MLLWYSGIGILVAMIMALAFSLLLHSTKPFLLDPRDRNKH